MASIDSTSNLNDRQLSASVIITAYNDQKWLEMLLDDLRRQETGVDRFEIIIVEAGRNDYISSLRAKLGSQMKVQYFHVPGISRTAGLNYAIERATSNFIVRLDARTHIDSRYLSQLLELRARTEAANVGGVQVPIGTTWRQKVVADVMQHPFCFGGAPFRRRRYTGYSNSVYLGAFDRDAVLNVGGFDERLPRISEDSDLNFRLIQSGYKVFVDSRINAFYYARETMSQFAALSKNYGVGRALFTMKHRRFTALRQLVPLLYMFAFVGCTVAALLLNFNVLTSLSATLVLLYGVPLISFSVSVGAGYQKRPAISMLYAMALFFLAHAYWVEGMIGGAILWMHRGRNDSTGIGDGQMAANKGNRA